MVVLHFHLALRVDPAFGYFGFVLSTDPPISKILPFAAKLTIFKTFDIQGLGCRKIFILCLNHIQDIRPVCKAHGERVARSKS